MSGLELPTAFTFLPDGRILVAEKAGVVRVVKDGTLLDRPFLDFTTRVNTYSNRGFLAIRASPDFETSGLVYVYYVLEDGRGDEAAPRTTRLSRVRADGDVAAPGSEEVVLGRERAGSCNDLARGADCIPADGDHNGGGIVFAADGTMFVTIGDGWLGTPNFNANSLRSQDLDSLAGKLLHITRDGEGIASNPFWTGDPDANRSKVWAYGLRNPWRVSLRPGTGVPYVGDVGWNEQEEIDVGRRGGNYGWPCYEGRARRTEYSSHATCRELYKRGRAAVVFPLSVQLHPGSTSITGGTFATSTTYPVGVRNAYFYADFGQNWLRHLAVDAEDELIPGSDVEFGRELAGPVSIETGPDGTIYYLAINSGELRHLVATGG